MAAFHGLSSRFATACLLGPAILVLLIYGHWPLMIGFAAAFFIACREWLFMARRTANPVSISIAGFSYLATCFAAFIAVRFDIDDGMWVSLALLIGIWASDSGAYFTGKMVGGPKLAPRLSPNKTWAGLSGAMGFFGLSLTICAVAFRPQMSVIEPPLAAIFCFGCLLGAIGQAGDLLVSALKRRSGVKDTGQLIPGHGGLLDRIDALLLVAPAAWLLLLLAAR